jgi:predicted membrane channel-forming protein YqfA (hemolysin III family)
LLSLVPATVAVAVALAVAVTVAVFINFLSFTSLRHDGEKWVIALFLVVVLKCLCVVVCYNVLRVS